MSSQRRIEKINETIVTHLLITVIIYIGCGLYYVLMTAWKSGKKPSATIDTTSRTIPRISRFSLRIKVLKKDYTKSNKDSNYNFLWS